MYFWNKSIFDAIYGFLGMTGGAAGGAFPIILIRRKTNYFFLFWTC
jgi:hypothetical protein